MLLPLILTALVAVGTLDDQPQRAAAVVSARPAWEALNAGRVREAAAAFDDLLRQYPTDPQVLLGAGVAAHQLGDRDAARRHLVDALRHDPALTPASLLLGDVLYATGDLASAIATYEAAFAQAPDHKLLRSRLEAWRKELALHDRFSQKLGDHFTVLFEGPAEEDLARTAVQILEAAYWRIGSALNTYPAEVITVVLYTREQFRDITQSPDWAGGAFDGRIRVPVQGALARAREFERVLTHEFVHALVRPRAPRGAPQWLNEGLAMHFDGTDVTAMQGRLEAAASVPDLRRLEGSFAGLDRADALLAYAKSAAAVKALLDEAGGVAVMAILGDLGRGVRFPEAFERHISRTYAEFDRRQP
jgi:tetratricopeptide (TPR) repeat protein